MTQSFLKFLITSLFVQTVLLAQNVNLDDAVHHAIDSNKPVVLFLHRVGCSYCNSMEEFTLESDEVKEYIDENFRLFPINITTDKKITYKGKTTTGLDFAIKIGYNFYPSTLFFNQKGELDYAAAGYINEQDFLLILKFIKSGAFHNMDLESYQKSIGYVKDSENEIVDERRHER